MRQWLCILACPVLLAAQEKAVESVAPVAATPASRMVDRVAPALVTVEVDLQIDPAGAGLRFRTPPPRRLSLRGTVVDGEHGVVAVPAALLEPLAGISIQAGAKPVPVALPARLEKAELVSGTRRLQLRWLGTDVRTGLAFFAAGQLPAGLAALVAEPVPVEASQLDDVIAVQPLASFAKPAFGLRRAVVAAKMVEPLAGWACDGEPGWPVFKPDGRLLGLVSMAVAGTPAPDLAASEKGGRRREAVAVVVPMATVAAAARDLLQKPPAAPAK